MYMLHMTFEYICYDIWRKQVKIGNYLFFLKNWFFFCLQAFYVATFVNIEELLKSIKKHLTDQNIVFKTITPELSSLLFSYTIHFEKTFTLNVIVYF